MNLKETYNRIAHDWFHDHKSDDWWVEGTDTFAEMLKAGSEILDVGCGAGVKSKYLAGKGFNVTGIDFSENLIDIARTNVPAATFTVLDLHDVSSLKKTFDGVFMQAVLLHIPKREAFDTVSELARIVRPGGLLYIAVKEVRTDRPEEHILTENDYGYEYSRFFSYYSLDELKDYFSKLDFHIPRGSPRVLCRIV